MDAPVAEPNPAMLELDGITISPDYICLKPSQRLFSMIINHINKHDDQVMEGVFEGFQVSILHHYDEKYFSQSFYHSVKTFLQMVPMDQLPEFPDENFPWRFYYYMDALEFYKQVLRRQRN